MPNMFPSKEWEEVFKDKIHFLKQEYKIEDVEEVFLILNKIETKEGLRGIFLTKQGKFIYIISSSNSSYFPSRLSMGYEEDTLEEIAKCLIEGEVERALSNEEKIIHYALNDLLEERCTTR